MIREETDKKIWGGNKDHTIKSEGLREQISLRPTFRTDSISFCVSETVYFYTRESNVCVEIVLQTYRSLL